MSIEMNFIQPSLPSECPVCGAYSLAPEANVSILLAVCDVLVIKALERTGNYILRADRSRHWQMEKAGKPHYLAHTMWQPSDGVVTKALRGAWDVVPMLLDTHGGCCEYEAGQVTSLLDGYVHDLVITGTAHDLDELAYRMKAQLGLPVYRTPINQEAGE